MSFKLKIIILIIISLAALALCIGAGSVYIAPTDIFSILLSKAAGTPLSPSVQSSFVPLIWDIRLPRALLAYITGAALSVSGAVMQTLLQNPLASPFGLGVSAGAGLGAALAIILGVSLFFMPLISLFFALITVVLTAVITQKLDRSFSNSAIILIGMVISLFCTALMSMAGAFNPDYAQRIQLFTLGSFSMRDWSAVYALAPATLAALVFFIALSRELNVMSFGEEQARTIGVNVSFVKKLLLAATAILTGTAVSFTGIIGFVDLVVPHIARKFTGADMRRVLPACALLGGIFMALCDLAARTLALPREIPIGVITALLGAPFFIYLFFAANKRRAV